MQNYYEILGFIPGNITSFKEKLEYYKNIKSDEILQKYKKKALEWHPDKNPDNKEFATEKFKAIANAYQCLTDTLLRASYHLKLEEEELNNRKMSEEAKCAAEKALKEKKEAEVHAFDLNKFFKNLPKIITNQKLALKNNKIKTLYDNYSMLAYSYTLVALKVGNLNKIELQNLQSQNKLLIFERLLNEMREELIFLSFPKALELQDFFQNNFAIYKSSHKLKTDIEMKIYKGNRDYLHSAYPLCIEFSLTQENIDDEKIKKSETIIVDNFIKATTQNFKLKRTIDTINKNKTNFEMEILLDYIDLSLKTKSSLKRERTLDSLAIESAKDYKEDSNNKKDLDTYREKLLAYMTQRIPQENYTGSRFGYSRLEKVTAAKSLCDVLSQRILSAQFFADKNAIKALKQGKLGEIAKEALMYAEKNLKHT